MAAKGRGLLKHAQIGMHQALKRNVERVFTDRRTITGESGNWRGTCSANLSTSKPDTKLSRCLVRSSLSRADFCSAQLARSRMGISSARQLQGRSASDPVMLWKFFGKSDRIGSPPSARRPGRCRDHATHPRATAHPARGIAARVEARSKATSRAVIGVLHHVALRRLRIAGLTDYLEYHEQREREMLIEKLGEFGRSCHRPWRSMMGRRWPQPIRGLRDGRRRGEVRAAQRPRPKAFNLSANIARHHLNAGQRAMAINGGCTTT